ncbi:MAG: hypothetical protein JSV92_04105 [archaeon]|nr:MAG: hypothetical protein JSV92_04105 [archaeon]
MEKYFQDAVDRFFDASKKWDLSKNVIMMYLAHENGAVPCFEVSGPLKYVKDERQVHFDCMKLQNIGLVEIYDGSQVTLGTTMYRATPLGIEVGKKIEEHEMDNGYPVTRVLIELTAIGRAEELKPDIKEEQDIVIKKLNELCAQISSQAS